TTARRWKRRTSSTGSRWRSPASRSSSRSTSTARSTPAPGGAREGDKFAPMSSVGAYLRQLRETRGVSLEEIARVTRVNSSYLHALEDEAFGELPVPVFTRGFIRAYCQALGESPDEALALYEGRTEVAAAPEPVPVIPTSARTPALRAAPASRGPATEAPPRNRGPVLVSFILLVV